MLNKTMSLMDLCDIVVRLRAGIVVLSLEVEVGDASTTKVQKFKRHVASDKELLTKLQQYNQSRTMRAKEWSEKWLEARPGEARKALWNQLKEEKDLPVLKDMKWFLQGREVLHQAGAEGSQTAAMGCDSLGRVHLAMQS